MLRYAAVFLVTVMSAAAGDAAEVKILAALAVQDALGPIGASFARDSGHTAKIAYSTVGAIRKRLAAGVRADVVRPPSDAVDGISRSGERSRSVPGAAPRTRVPD